MNIRDECGLICWFVDGCFLFFFFVFCFSISGTDTKPWKVEEGLWKKACTFCWRKMVSNILFILEKDRLWQGF